ncbi:MAG TPA: extracellular solute-binding protein [Patescibacteria group bacterium]|nr:extracellular solute-binding protein [Patescibacteria group bacterium]
MKFFLKNAILAILFALILSGCKLIPGINNQGQVSLTYWGLWESAVNINRLISDYQKDHPNVTITYEKKSHQQYRESLQNRIEAGEGPDIFRFHNTWVPMLQGVLSEVPADVVSSSEFRDNFYPTVSSDLRNSQKKFVGVPLEIDGLGLFWNEEIFNAAGITTPPKTWQELADTASKLTVRGPTGNITTAGVALGTASNVDHFSDILGMMILQNGGDPKLPTGQQAADALDYFASFARGESRVWDSSLPSSTVAFTGGNLAMYFGPSWRAIEIKNNNPLLKFQVAPVPQLEGGKVAWASYWAEGVSAKSSHQKEAWEFVKYLQQEDVLVKLYSEAAKTPGRIFGEPYPKVSMAPKIASDPILGAFIADAPYMKSAPMASRTFDNGLNDQMIKAYEDAINIVLKGSRAADALETAAKNVETVLSRFGAK